MKSGIALVLTLGLSAGTDALAQSNAILDMGRMSAASNTPVRATLDWRADAAAEGRLWQFAACAVRDDGDLARSLLEAAPLTPEAQRRSIKLFRTSKCTAQAGALKLRNDVLRWAVAEQLYRVSEPGVPAIPAGQPAAVAIGDSYALGRCVAQRDPSAADAFVRTARRSTEEIAVHKKLVPALNACAGSAKFNLSGAELHGVLAEALYKMRGSAAQGMN